MSFQAQPGTIQFRAITWLQRQPAGTEVTASMWGEGIGVEGTTLAVCIKPAIDAGAVRRRTKDGMQRPMWFSLGDGTPPVREVEGEEEGDPLPPRTSAPDVQPSAGALLPGVARVKEPKPAPSLKVPKFVGQVPERKPLPLYEELKPQPPFDVWFSGVSGELVIQGAHMDADGDVVLPKEQVRQLLAALTGLPA
jgi:hypothetical protein